MAKIQNKPHLTNFIKQNYIWILMIVTMSCIHLLYMYLIGARKQDLMYAAVLDAILLLITVLVGFFRYSSKVKALSNALKRPVEEQAQLPEATDDVEMLYHRLTLTDEGLLVYVGAPDKDSDIGYETTA